MIAFNTGIVDDADKRLSQDGVIMSVENGAMKRPVKDAALIGGNILCITVHTSLTGILSSSQLPEFVMIQDYLGSSN